MFCKNDFCRCNDSGTTVMNQLYKLCEYVNMIKKGKSIKIKAVTAYYVTSIMFSLSSALFSQFLRTNNYFHFLVKITTNFNKIATYQNISFCIYLVWSIS